MPLTQKLNQKNRSNHHVAAVSYGLIPGMRERFAQIALKIYSVLVAERSTAYRVALLNVLTAATEHRALGNNQSSLLEECTETRCAISIALDVA